MGAFGGSGMGGFGTEMGGLGTEMDPSKGIVIEADEG